MKLPIEQVLEIGGSPFFLAGSILWLVAPILSMYNMDSTSSAVGMFAAAFFLVDCAIALTLWIRNDERSLMLLTSVVVYGLASLLDFAISICDILKQDTFFGYFWLLNFPSDLFFFIAGTLEFLYFILKGKKFAAFGSFFFAAGGAAYVVSGFVCEYPPGICNEFEILAAVFFVINALCLVVPIMRNRCKKKLNTEVSERTPLCKEESTPMQQEEVSPLMKTETKEKDEIEVLVSDI